MAIDGDGFFQVQMPDGTLAYTRDGSFKLTGEGRFATSDGYYLEPDLSIPEDAISIAIGYDGRVAVIQADSTEPTEVGQIELARFVNPAGLSALGHNLFQETPASGTPLVAVATEEGLGQIQQGYLEMSNVDVVSEMVNMIVAQRAYEINSKVIQTADDMSSLVNNLKR
jgi:flagellar basal-body rod protein FlgG